MTRRPWPPHELALLRDLFPNVPTGDVAALLGRSYRSTSSQAHLMSLRKSAAFFASDLNGRIQRGKQLPSMIRSQFKAGFTPWNKGMKGLDIGGKSTRFQPGQSPRNTQPIGALRVNKDGHLQRKISKTPGNNSKRWRGVAELVWCAQHGPLPAKHIVVFKRGMFTKELQEITLDRVECISKADNARRNHPHSKHPELGRLVQLKGAITRQVNRISREAANQTQERVTA